MPSYSRTPHPPCTASASSSQPSQCSGLKNRLMTHSRGGPATSRSPWDYRRGADGSRFWPAHPHGRRETARNSNPDAAWRHNPELPECWSPQGCWEYPPQVGTAFNVTQSSRRRWLRQGSEQQHHGSVASHSTDTAWEYRGHRKWAAWIGERLGYEATVYLHATQMPSNTLRESLSCKWARKQSQRYKNTFETQPRSSARRETRGLSTESGWLDKHKTIMNYMSLQTSI